MKKRTPKLLFAAYLLTAAAASFANAQLLDKTVLWQRGPIKITLPVGKERFVTFPNEVKFGYNTAFLPSSVFSVENDNRTLYLLAKRPFQTQRVEAELASGEIILLDIRAELNVNDNPVDIELPHVQNNGSPNASRANSANLNYAGLVRYAAQQLYAPERLLRSSFSITRFPMGTDHVVPLFYDSSAIAMPLASWRGGDLYVTALTVKNLLNQSLQLNSNLLCGDWKAASFFPQTTISAKGAKLNKDTTTLFLISSRPFSKAIKPCLSE